MYFSATKCFAPTELGSWSGSSWSISTTEQEVVATWPFRNAQALVSGTETARSLPASCSVVESIECR
jgi:hypothetical protein